MAGLSDVHSPASLTSSLDIPCWLLDVQVLFASYSESALNSLRHQLLNDTKRLEMRGGYGKTRSERAPKHVKGARDASTGLGMTRDLKKHVISSGVPTSEGESGRSREISTVAL